MSLGMIVKDYNNKVVHRELSNVGSLSNGNNGCDEEKLLGANVLVNGSSNGCYNTASTLQPLKFKPRKVFAVRKFPPGCGSMVTRLRSRMASGPEVGFLSKDGENLGHGEDQIGNDMDVAVTEEPVKEQCDELMMSKPEDVNLVVKPMEPLESERIRVAGARKAKKAVDATLKPTKMRKKSESNLCSNGGESCRGKVKETLRVFYRTCRKLLQEEEAKLNKEKNFRVDFKASNILKSQGKFLNVGVQIMGSVPGVEVGDEFQFRMELNILGMHRPSQSGIDYMRVGTEILATSIVCSGWYDDELDNSDVLTYTGQGGNIVKITKEKKEPMDQRLVTGNLALANSMTKRNPVRVIKGHKKAVKESSGDAKSRYVYDGLYVVEEFWKETGSHGKLVFKFKLRRIPGQPELSWKVVTKSKKLECRQGVCKLDISEGKERLPICNVNEIDDEKPPSFIYTTKMIYPDWLRRNPPKACGCTTRCTEARNCACVAKNGGEIPYNYDGAIVERKNLIYECGPLCKCPASCYLRVSQRGIKFQLEIFKTESRGWGLRSLCSIPSGSFICEYAGELLEDKEAEKRTGNDEYLFDIGNNYDSTLADGIPQGHATEEEDDEASGFTIDARVKGNVGRFINHSCSPNLYAQDVLYDHEDIRIPHVMFFALDNIPPLQELCYDYNYKVDQVRDSNGNIKKKNCYCGSNECTGRLY